MSVSVPLFCMCFVQRDCNPVCVRSFARPCVSCVPVLLSGRQRRPA
uniref:Uncharacterized protein n=1 Tax=Anguilla anguilla TaxID=7936 RepID=A0A0E9VYX1_ANGAN